MSVYQEFTRITKDIRRFARKMKGVSDPVLVPLRPLDGMLPLECYMNCEQMVNLFGGDIVYGWHVYSIPKVFLEAEAHAVWRDKNGTLFDVTPNAPPSPTIAFIPDLTWKWIEGESRPLPCRYYPLSEDSRVQEYIRLAKRKDELHAAFYPVRYSAPPPEEFLRLKLNLQELMMAILGQSH